MASYQWELYGRDVIAGRRGALLRPLLKVASLFYSALVRLRNALYDWKWFSATKPEGVQVISVGNITVGGTGKTPVVMELIRSVAPKPVAVLSRGYRTADEPQMIAMRFSHAEVFVDSKRVRSAARAKQKGHKWLLMDDGMQHRKLKRDIEVVVVDGVDPFGGGSCLPRGFLREPPEALRRADYVVIHRPQKVEEVVKKIRNYTEAPTIVTDLQVKQVVTLEGHKINLADQKVGLFCALGQPDRFQSTVQGLGATVCETLFLPDHAHCSMKQLEDFAKSSSSKGAHVLVCTEKDRVKIDPTIKLSLPIACVEVELDIVEGLEVWNDLVQRMDR